MFTSSSVWLGTSVCTPGIAHDRPKVHVLVQPEPRLQQQIAFQHPRLDARVADRAEEDRVEAAQPLELVVGQRVARAQVAVGPEIEFDQVERRVAPHGIEHLEALADDLRARAVAPDHPDAIGTRHGVSSFVAALRVRDVHRAVDGREVRPGARLDHVGRDTATGDPAPVDVDLHDDVT